LSKNNNIEKKPKKIKKVGRRKMLLILLWSVFLFAFGWSIYKNFTAIDQHTVYETKVVEKEIIDTSAVQSFVSKFAKEFYSFASNEESLKARKENLSFYMTDDLILLNADLIKSGSETSAEVTDFKIWNIEEYKDIKKYKLVYSVKQKINTVEIEMQKEKIKEKIGDQEVEKEVEKPVPKEVSKIVEDYYSVIVYTDTNKNMVVTENPTITNIPTRAEYKDEESNLNTNVNAEESKEITAFLENFFALYPMAEETTIMYYTADNILPVIKREYKFVELTKKVYVKDNEKVNTYIAVKYLDENSGLIHISQYNLTLEKNQKWIITSNNIV